MSYFSIVEELYKEHILDHAEKPRNKRVISSPAISADGENPSCGDFLTLFVLIDGGSVKDAAFTGEGCAISQASASLLTGYLRGKTLGELRLMVPGDMYNLLKISITPSRTRCALLPYEALELALKKI